MANKITYNGVVYRGYSSLYRELAARVASHVCLSTFTSRVRIGMAPDEAILSEDATCVGCMDCTSSEDKDSAKDDATAVGLEIEDSYHALVGFKTPREGSSAITAFPYPANLLALLLGEEDSRKLYEQCPEDMMAGCAKALEYLDPLHRTVIDCVLRDKMTYDKAGAKLGLSRSRVGIILNEGVRKLRGAPPVHQYYWRYGLNGGTEKLHERYGDILGLVKNLAKDSSASSEAVKVTEDSTITRSEQQMEGVLTVDAKDIATLLECIDILGDAVQKFSEDESKILSLLGNRLSVTSAYRNLLKVYRKERDAEEIVERDVPVVFSGGHAAVEVRSISSAQVLSPNYREHFLMETLHPHDMRCYNHIIDKACKMYLNSDVLATDRSVMDLCGAMARIHAEHMTGTTVESVRNYLHETVILRDCALSDKILLFVHRAVSLRNTAMMARKGYALDIYKASNWISTPGRYCSSSCYMRIFRALSILDHAMCNVNKKQLGNIGSVVSYLYAIFVACAYFDGDLKSAVAAIKLSSVSCSFGANNISAAENIVEHMKEYHDIAAFRDSRPCEYNDNFLWSCVPTKNNLWEKLEERAAQFATGLSESSEANPLPCYIDEGYIESFDNIWS